MVALAVLGVLLVGPMALAVHSAGEGSRTGCGMALGCEPATKTALMPDQN